MRVFGKGLLQARISMWLHSDMWGFMPEINTVIREIVCGSKTMYGVEDILEILGVEVVLEIARNSNKNTVRLTRTVV